MNPYLRIRQYRHSSFYYARGVLQTEWPEAVQEPPKVSVHLLQEWPIGLAKQARLTTEPNVAVAKIGLYLNDQLVVSLQMMKALLITGSIFEYKFHPFVLGIPEAGPLNDIYIEVWPEWESSPSNQRVLLLGDSVLAKEINEAAAALWKNWNPKPPPTFEMASNGIADAFAKTKQDGNTQVTIFCGGTYTNAKVDVRFAFWNFGGFTDEEIPVYSFTRYHPHNFQTVHSPIAYLDGKKAVETGVKEQDCATPPALNTVELKWLTLEKMVEEAKAKLEEKK